MNRIGYTTQLMGVHFVYVYSPFKGLNKCAWKIQKIRLIFLSTELWALGVKLIDKTITARVFLASAFLLRAYFWLRTNITLFISRRYRIQGGGDRFSVHFAVTFLNCWRTSFCVTTIIKIVNNNTNDKQTSGISGVRWRFTVY